MAVSETTTVDGYLWLEEVQRAQGIEKVIVDDVLTDAGAMHT